MLRGAPVSVASSSPSRNAAPNFPVDVRATGLALNRRTAHSTPGTPRTRVRSVSLSAFVCSKYSVFGSITQTSASTTSSTWLPVRFRIPAKIEVWFCSRKVQKEIAKTRARYFARSPVSICNARRGIGSSRSGLRADRPAGTLEIADRFQDVVPALLTELLLHVPLHTVPGGQRAIQDPLPGRGQRDLLLTTVVARENLDPTRLLHGLDRARERRLVDQRSLGQIDLWERPERFEHTKEHVLLRMDPMCGKLLLVGLGDSAARPAQGRAKARERELGKVGAPRSTRRGGSGLGLRGALHGYSCIRN